MTPPSRRNGARDDKTFTDEQKVTVFRHVFCDKMSIAAACRAVGCDTSTYHGWKLNPEYKARALELGPTDGAAAPGGSGPADEDDIFASLPPIGQEKPDNPSPEFMAILASYYSLRPEPAALDRLAGWPSGSVQSWFDRRDDVGCAIRVAVLERAREIRAAMILEGMASSGNTVALRTLAISLGALTETPPAAKNAAEGHSLGAIMGDLKKRLWGKE